MTRRGGLDGAVGIPPFLSKTYELVDDVSTNHIVSWMGDGESFVVWTPPEFARDVLPRHFKHNNFSSFVRQLNTYGFRKVDPDRWEFANENFVRGRRDLLKDIHRRKPTNQHHSSHNDDSSALVSTPNPAIELGQYGGLAGEVESLKRDKNLLFGEVLRLRQQQQASDQEQAKLRKRLEGMELGLQQIMGFMAQFASKPELLRNLTHNVQGLPALPSNTVLKGGNRKKRRANGDEDVSHSDPHSSIVQYVAPDMQSFLQSLSSRDASTNCRTAPQGWQPQGQENVLQAFDSLNLEQEPLVSSPPEPSVQIDVEDPSSPGNEERLHIREITPAAGDGELPPASAATAPAVGSPMPGLSTAAAAAARLDADAPTAAAAAAVPADSLPASAALSLTDGTFPRALHASGPTQLQLAAAAPEFATPFTPFTAAATPSAEPPAAEAALAAGEDAVGQAVPAAQGFADAVAGAPAAVQPAPSPGAANAAGADAAAAAAGWGPFLGELDVLGELDGLSSLPSIDHLLQGDSSLDFLALQPTQQ